MIYGLSPRLFVENGPAILAAEARSHSNAAAYRAWAHLTPERRLELIERSLLDPANDDRPDGLPAAL